MKHKQTLFISFVFFILCAAWSGNAFAQDTTWYEEDDKKLERAVPAGEGGDYIEDEPISTRYDEEVRMVPGMEENKGSPNDNSVYLNEKVSKREFDKAKWKEQLEGKRYRDDVPEPKEREEKKEEEGKTDSPGLSVPAAGSAMQFVLFGIVIILMVFLLYKLLGGTFVSNRKFGNDKVFTIEEIEERIHESDLDRLLREALQRGDFRLAVRIYYLAIIKELSLKDWIRWKKDKTNREYVNELIARKPELSTGFRDATFAFEKVWYGDLEIKEKEYNILSPRFRSFIENINKMR